MGSGLFGEMNDWRKKSGITCTFLVFAVLNIAMLVVGIMAIGQCPAEPMIPNYLIVAGSTSLSLLLVRLVVSHVLVPSLESTSILKTDEEGKPQAKERGGQDSSKSQTQQSEMVEGILKALSVYDSLASLFSTVWLVVGSVYVYGTSPKYVGDPYADADFCDYSAYTFAFVVITIGYVSLVLSVLAAVLTCCFKTKE